MKIITKSILILFFLIISTLFYLSFFGLETNKFNNQISKEIKKFNKNFEVDLNKIRLILDPFEFKIYTKTFGTKIKSQNKTLEIENIKAEISLKSFFNNKFSIENIKISTKSLQINDLIKVLKSFKRSPELFIFEKIVKKGYVIADIEIEFDDQGEIKKNYNVNGFVKDVKFNSFDNYNIEKLDFIFNYKKDNLKLSDLTFTFNNLVLFSKEINLTNLKDKFLISGEINHKKYQFDKRQLNYFSNLFVSHLNIEKAKLSSKNVFSFKLNKKFKIEDLKIDSKILIDELLITNNLDLKYLFPKVKKSIGIYNNEIDVVYIKENLRVNGKGKISIQERDDEISYFFNKKNKIFKFKTTLSVKDNPLVLDFLNYKKNNKKQLSIYLEGSRNENEETFINSLSLTENKNKIEINDLLINKKSNILDFNRVILDFFDTDNQRNLVQINKKNNEFIVKGKFFNANNLLNILLNEKKNNSRKIDIRKKIKIKIDKVRLDKNHDLNNFSGNLSLKSGDITNANIIGNLSNDKQLRFTVITKNNNKISTLYLDKAEPLVKRFDFINGFSEGELDFYSSKKINKSESTLKIYDFKLKELPVLTKILTLASLQGIADILTGEGIRFDEFEMNYTNDGSLMTINEMYAIGPAISILMDGYIEKDKLISLRGTLVPATTINKAIGTIPVLGKILVGSKTGEGVFGVSFKIKGPPKKLETTVNPIKTLTPRFITRTLEKIKKN